MQQMYESLKGKGKVLVLFKSGSGSYFHVKVVCLGRRIMKSLIGKAPRHVVLNLGWHPMGEWEGSIKP